jgi:hypothetical protein
MNQYAEHSANLETTLGSGFTYCDTKLDLSKFEWKPTNLNYGLVPLNIFCYHGLDTFYNTDQVPWSHGREVVPLWLANDGVTLNTWQEWVDRGTALWIERNEVLRKLIKLGSTYTRLLFFEISLIFISPYLPYTLVFLVWHIFLFFYIMFLFVYGIWWRRFKNEAIYRIEEKWSDLISDMNSILENHTPINAQHCYRQNTVSCSCCQRPLTNYTVGVTFCKKVEGEKSLNESSFRKMKPKDSPTTESTFEDFIWEIKVRPVDPNYGRFKRFMSYVWGTSDKDIMVPWSYERDKVPKWLSFQGVTLTEWQGWLDQANSLWIERIQQSNKISKMKLLMSLLYLPLLLLIWIPWRIVIPREYSHYLLRFIVLLSMILFCFLIAFSKFDQRQQFVFLENEWKWSDLVHSINAKIVRDLGFRSNHCYDTTIGRVDFSFQTVGLEFSMEPGILKFET